MANEDKLRKAYESAKKHYTLPDFETFKADMQDETKLSKFRDNLSVHYDVPDFETFRNDMGLLKKKEPTSANTQIPSRNLSQPSTSLSREVSPQVAPSSVSSSPSGQEEATTSNLGATTQGVSPTTGIDGGETPIMLQKQHQPYQEPSIKPFGGKPIEQVVAEKKPILEPIASEEPKTSKRNQSYDEFLQSLQEEKAPKEIPLTQEKVIDPSSGLGQGVKIKSDILATEKQERYIEQYFPELKKNLDKEREEYQELKDKAKGSAPGALWNSVVDGYTKTVSDMSELIMGAIDYTMRLVDDDYKMFAEMNEMTSGKKSSEIISDFTSDIKQVLDDRIKDASTNEEFSKLLQKDSYLWQGAIGLAGSAYPMITPGMSGFFAQGTIDGMKELEELNPNASEEERFLYGATQGAVMMALERFGFSNLLKKTPYTRKLISKLTGEAMQELLKKGEKVVGKSIVETAETLISSYASEFETGALQEIGEEVVKQTYDLISGEDNFENKIKSITDLQGLKDFAGDVIISGHLEGIGGGIMGSIKASADVITTPSNKKIAKQYVSTIDRLEQELQNPNITEETRVQISEQLKSTADKLLTIIKDDYSVSNSLSEEAKTKVNEIWKEIDGSKKIMEDPNVSSETKEILNQEIENKGSEIEEIIAADEKIKEETTPQEAEQALQQPVVSEEQTQEQLPEGKQKVSLAIAPLFRTTVDSPEQAQELQKLPFYQEFKKNVEEVGNLFGVTVVESEDIVGSFEGGQEASSIFSVEGNWEDIVNFAAVMGALTPEVQKSTIASRFTDEGSPQHNTDAFEIEVDDVKKAMKALQEAGVTEYSIRGNTILLFDPLDEEGVGTGLQEQVNKFNIIYKQNGGTIKSERKRAIESEYIDYERRGREFLPKIEESALYEGNTGGKATRLREILKQAKERNKRLTAWQEIDNSKDATDYKLLRQKQLEFAVREEKLPEEDLKRIKELEDALAKKIEPFFEGEKESYEEAKKQVEEIANEVAELVADGFVSKFGIKRPSRAAEKTVRWYSVVPMNLGDGARTNIIVNTNAEADFIHEEIRRRYGTTVDRTEQGKTELGYPKRLVEVRTKSGKIAEIQAMTIEGYLAKDGVSMFPADKQKLAEDALDKTRELIGWNIPSGIGHYFYELHRDPNVPKELRDKAVELSNKYYEAMQSPETKTWSGEDFLNEMKQFKETVDAADKSSWDKSNKAKSPYTLDLFLLNDVLDGMTQGQAPMSNTKVYNTVVGVAQKMANEKDIKKGDILKRLPKEVSKETEGRITPEDISEITDEINKIEDKKIKEQQERDAKELAKQKEKQDAVQEQTTSKVSPQPGAGVSKKVEEGTSKAEPKKPTEKSEKVVKEQTSPKLETEGEKYRYQSQDFRAAEMSDDKTKEKLLKLAKYKVETFEETSKYVDEMISLLGPEGAIQEVSALPDTDVKKVAVITEAAAMIVRDSRLDMQKALKEGDEKVYKEAEYRHEKGLMYIHQMSTIKRKGGQINSYTQKTYQKYPSVFQLSKKHELDAHVKNVMGKVIHSYTDENGESVDVTIQDAIDQVRENIKSQTEKVIEDELTDGVVEELKKRVSSLEEQVEKLKEQKDQKVSEKREKIKQAKKKFEEAKRKALGGKGEVSASLFGLTSSQIEGIGEMIAALIEMGYRNTDLIISTIYDELKGGINNLTKAQIKTIGREIDEFKSMHDSELDKSEQTRLQKLQTKLEQLQKGQENIEGKEKKEDSDEVKKLKEEIEKEKVLTAEKIREVVKDHYLGKSPYARTLAQTIAKKTGLSESESEIMAEVIEQRILDRIKPIVESEMTRFIKDAYKPKTEELRKKRREGKISEEELKELEKRIEQSKSQQEVNRIMKLFRLGKISDNHDFAKAFENKFGFRTLSSETKKQLDSIAEQLFNLENKNERKIKKQIESGVEKEFVINATHKQQMLRLQRKYNSILEANKKLNYALALREITSAIYIHILSGPLTFVRAFIGGYGSGAIGTGVYLLSNVHKPKALFEGFKAVWKALPSAYKLAVESRKTGINFYGESALKGEMSQESQGKYEQMMLSGLGSAFKNKEWLKVGYKSVGQLLKVIHALGSLDAFMNTVGGTFVGTVEKSKKEGLPSQYFDSVYEDIAKEDWNEYVNSIKETVENEEKSGKSFPRGKEYEIEFRIKDGIGLTGSRLTAKKTFITNRIQELRQNELGEYLEDGVNLSKDASLMGTPDGYAGLIFRKVRPALDIKQEDDVQTATTKLILNMVFKFVRITGQLSNKTLNNIPVLGLANAFLGGGYNHKTGEFDADFFKGKLRANPLLVKQRVANNLLITSTVLAAYLLMFDDDEEEGLKLKEDRPLDVRGFGLGYKENREKYENYQELSISFTKNEQGEFENYIRVNLLPEVAAFVSTIAVLSDYLKGDVSDKQLKEMKKSPLTNSMYKALGDNAKILTESSFSSVGRMVKQFMYEDNLWEGMANVGRGVIIDNTKPLVQPTIFRGIAKEFYKANNAKEKEAKEWDKFTQGLYGIDYYLEDNKTDVFGNEYPVEGDYERFMQEMFGKGTKRSEENKETVGLLYKFDKGVNVTKQKFSDMLSDSPKGFSVDTKIANRTVYIRYESFDDKIADEAQKIQEDRFKELVLKYYDSLDKVDSPEVLEDRLKSLQSSSIDYAKAQIVKKYKDTDKIKIIKKN